MKQYAYFNGDKGEYTGKSEVIHGATFYQLKMIEGQFKGKFKVIINAPKTTTKEQS